MVIFRGNCRSSSGHLALWRLGQRSPEVHPALPSAQSPHHLPSSQATPCADSRPRGPGPGLVWPLLPQRPRALPLALCGVPQASAQFHSSAAVPALDVEVATHSRGDAALASPRPRQKPLEGSRCSAAPDA